MSSPGQIVDPPTPLLIHKVGGARRNPEVYLKVLEGEEEERKE